MQIVELSDYSMVVMKDSEDSMRFSIGTIYRLAKQYRSRIYVKRIDADSDTYDAIQETDDCIYTAGRLVLFFKDHISSKFQLHDKVLISF